MWVPLWATGKLLSLSGCVFTVCLLCAFVVREEVFGGKLEELGIVVSWRSWVFEVGEKKGSDHR